MNFVLFSTSRHAPFGGERELLININIYCVFCLASSKSAEHATHKTLFRASNFAQNKNTQDSFHRPRTRINAGGRRKRADMEENIWLIGWKFRAADKCCWPEKEQRSHFAFHPEKREEFRYCCTRGLLVFLKTISILPREQPKSSAGLLEIFSEFHFHVVCCAGPDNRRDIDSSHTQSNSHYASPRDG